MRFPRTNPKLLPSLSNTLSLRYLAKSLRRRRGIELKPGKGDVSWAEVGVLGTLFDIAGMAGRIQRHRVQEL